MMFPIRWRHHMTNGIEIRAGLTDAYADVYTHQALSALRALAPLDVRRQQLMHERIERRAKRARERRRLTFLDSSATIAGTGIGVADARAGKFVGSEIPVDLRRQWIQGTGPAAKPNTPVEKSIRNIAHALLSGADGWMFDGEDALGRCRPCRSTTSETSSSPFIAIRYFFALRSECPRR